MYVYMLVNKKTVINIFEAKLFTYKFMYMYNVKPFLLVQLNTFLGKSIVTCSPNKIRHLQFGHKLSDHKLK
jgi:hypothetical protein